MEIRLISTYSILTVFNNLEQLVLKEYQTSALMRRRCYHLIDAARPQFDISHADLTPG